MRMAARAGLMQCSCSANSRIASAVTMRRTETVLNGLTLNGARDASRPPEIFLYVSPPYGEPRERPKGGHAVLTTQILYQTHDGGNKAMVINALS